MRLSYYRRSREPETRRCGDRRGIAGVSIAYELAAHRQVTLLETETSLATHSTGRSAAMYVPGHGVPLVRILINASRLRFASLPAELGAPVFLRPRPVLWVAFDDDGEQALRAALAQRADEPDAPVELSPEEALARCPVLRRDGLRRGGLRAAAVTEAAGDLDAMALLSPGDETPAEPGDARPDPLDVAVALELVEAATGLGLRSVQSSWSGLRSFVADRAPVVGAWPQHPGFHFFAGQGGSGIETAPALAALGAATVIDAPLPPDIPLDPAALAPPDWPNAPGFAWAGRGRAREMAVGCPTKDDWLATGRAQSVQVGREASWRQGQ